MDNYKLTNVLSFNRDAEYLLSRASLNRRQGRLLEALKLARRAVESQPSSAAGWMEMAQTLCEMGCCEQSNGVLSLMLSVPGAPGDCYFGMSCNFLGLGDIQAAFGAMMNLIAVDPGSLERADVVEVLKSIVKTHIGESFSERMNMRVDRLCHRAEEYIDAGRLETGLELARRGYELDPGSQDCARIYARALMAANETDASIEIIEKALTDDDPLMATELEAVRLYTRAGKGEKAVGAFKRLMSRKPSDAAQIAICLEAACEIGDDETVAVLAAKALRLAPFDTKLFHVCAVNRSRLKRPAEQAISFWTRASSIDPDDAVIKYYLRAAESGKDLSNASYARELPEDEARRLDSELRRALVLRDAELSERLDSEGAARDMCRWAMRSTAERKALARGLLSRAGCPWAKRELAIGRAESYRVRFSAIKCKQVTAITNYSLGSASLAPVLERAVRLASREMRETLGGNNIAYLYQALGPVADIEKLPRFVDSRAWAAVLAVAALKPLKKEMSLEHAALMLRCPVRRAKLGQKIYVAHGGSI